MSKPSYPGAARVAWWAHRGTVRHENTLRGIEDALAAGADGVELDLQVSADGVVFVFHDDDLDRVAGVEGRARARSWAQLKGLRVCGGEAIPRLEEVLERWPSGKTLNLELKRGGEALVSALEPLVAGRREVVISSFNAHMLRSAARLDLPRALLLERPSKAWLHAHGARDLQVPWVHLEACLIADWVLERYAEEGVSVGAWGAESPERERELVELGVERIITDFLSPAA